MIELRTRIFSFINPEDLFNWRLVCKNFSKLSDSLQAPTITMSSWKKYFEYYLSHLNDDEKKKLITGMRKNFEKIFKEFSFFLLNPAHENFARSFFYNTYIENSISLKLHGDHDLTLNDFYTALKELTNKQYLIKFPYQWLYQKNDLLNYIAKYFAFVLNLTAPLTTVACKPMQNAYIVASIGILCAISIAIALFMHLRFSQVIRSPASIASALGKQKPVEIKNLRGVLLWGIACQNEMANNLTEASPSPSLD